MEIKELEKELELALKLSIESKFQLNYARKLLPNAPWLKIETPNGSVKLGHSELKTGVIPRIVIALLEEHYNCRNKELKLACSNYLQQKQ